LKNIFDNVFAKLKSAPKDLHKTILLRKLLDRLSVKYKFCLLVSIRRSFEKRFQIFFKTQFKYLFFYFELFSHMCILRLKKED